MELKREHFRIKNTITDVAKGLSKEDFYKYSTMTFYTCIGYKDYLLKSWLYKYRLDKYLNKLKDSDNALYDISYTQDIESFDYLLFQTKHLVGNQCISVLNPAGEMDKICYCNLFNIIDKNMKLHYTSNGTKAFKFDRYDNIKIVLRDTVQAISGVKIKIIQMLIYVPKK